MIRKYRAEDLKEVLEAWRAASALAHPFLSDEFLAAEGRQVEHRYLPIADTWVWESAGRVVGFISLLGTEVGGLFVHPRFQRSGIGRALVDHARARCGELEVEVAKANRIGRAFYGKYGFVPLEEKVDEETGLEVLRLRLAGAPPAG